ncbi:MAG: amino acid permease [Sphingobacteriales bacterium]|nr:amino acid permease [Sphingobacteriales bacterium]
MKQLFRTKPIESYSQSHGQLRRGSLSVIDLTSLGIAAIIGGGIFSAIGEVAARGGPGVSLLFIFTAIACGFSGLCYAVFASRIPVSGSAYTYAYVSFGELIAWIIGWDLILEYAIGNIAVALSWSDYFTGMLDGLGIHLPEYLTCDYWTASHQLTQEGTIAWQQAPVFLNIRLIGDIPAFLIVVFISVFVYVGIRESKIAGNLMVLLKIVVLLIVIGIGAFYIHPENWKPFAPHGISGILKGVGGVFFAYIGFDAITTTAEECRHPQRDLPKAMIASLLITTVLYVVITLVLTGIVRYSDLEGGDPLAKVFRMLNMPFISFLVAFGAIIAMASVLLVFQVGQPRIWMSMSRDGLLPSKFSHIHKRFKTPDFATIITCLLVALPSLFLNISEVTDLTSIGTLFAFILVCGGVFILEDTGKLNSDNSHKGFQLPKIKSRWVVPFVWLAIILFSLFFNRDNLENFFSFHQGESFFHQLFSKILSAFFILCSVIVSVRAVMKNLNAIPVFGLMTNLFLMTELTTATWIRFLVWMCIGLCIYFFFSRKNSLLNVKVR